MGICGVCLISVLTKVVMKRCSPGMGTTPAWTTSCCNFLNPRGPATSGNICFHLQPTVLMATWTFTTACSPLSRKVRSARDRTIRTLQIRVRSEFFQNSGIFARKFLNFGKFQHFLKYQRNSERISSKSEQHE